VIFAAIADWVDSDDFPVTFMCDQLGVSTSGYYKWRTREPSAHEARDTDLTRLITVFFARLRGNPGVRRMHAELAVAGHRVSRKRVWRLMRAAGLQGRHPRAWKRTTVPGEHPTNAPDLIGRSFTGASVNEKWCGDITYIKTWDGWAYVATVIDLHSRALVGWAVADHMRTSLVTDALDMAIAHRRPPKDVIFHSDRGTQGVSRIRQVLHAAQHSTIPRQDRDLLRQRRVRVVLRDLQERTHPHPTMAQPEDADEGDVQLGRGVLQPHKTPLHARILDAGRIRTRLQKHPRTRRLNPRPPKWEHST
jgi:transposase InsO family protein